MGMAFWWKFSVIQQRKWCLVNFSRLPYYISWIEYCFTSAKPVYSFMHKNKRKRIVMFVFPNQPFVHYYFQQKIRLILWVHMVYQHGSYDKVWFTNMVLMTKYVICNPPLREPIGHPPSSSYEWTQFTHMVLITMCVVCFPSKREPVGHPPSSFYEQTWFTLMVLITTSVVCSPPKEPVGHSPSSSYERTWFTCLGFITITMCVYLQPPKEGANKSPSLQLHLLRASLRQQLQQQQNRSNNASRQQRKWVKLSTATVRAHKFLTVISWNWICSTCSV